MYLTGRVGEKKQRRTAEKQKVRAHLAGRGSTLPVAAGGVPWVFIRAAQPVGWQSVVEYPDPGVQIEWWNWWAASGRMRSQSKKEGQMGGGSTKNHN